MTKPEAVVIIGAGLLQVPLIHEAKRMGLSVIVTDSNPMAPGVQVADAFFPASTYDIEETLAYLPAMQAAHALRGVCTAGADVAPTVAAVAEAARVPGISVAVAHRTHNKAEVREVLDEAGLACYQPRYLCVVGDHSTALRTRVITESSVIGGWPVVVKPLQQRASRGVSIAATPDEFAIAVAKALPYGKEYLIEECLVGTEHSAEAILDTDGALLWFNIVDRPFSYESGTGIELGHINPTLLDAGVQQQIQLMLLAAARALGVMWGPFKVDVMLTADGPKILECTARLSGGFDCQKTSPLTGRHPMRQLLQLSCGLPVERQGQPKGFAACAAILPQRAGVVTSLPIEQGILWAITPGQQIAPAKHNGERAGYVIAAADDYHVAWGGAASMAEACATFIDTTILPLNPV